MTPFCVNRWCEMFRKMICVGVLVAYLLTIPGTQADPRTSTRKYKPVIQVTEEIDVNDITFTTSVPDFQDAAKHHSKTSYPSPSAFPYASYKNSYGVPIAVEKTYNAGPPKIASTIKHKPYKVFKVQEDFRPIPYNPQSHRATAYGTPETNRFSAKIVPFSSQLPTKAATRESSFLTQKNKNFIPSSTFSPTVFTQINSDNSQKFTEPADIKPFTIQRVVDWEKPTKKPLHVKKGKNFPENHYLGVVPEDFRPIPNETPTSTTPYKESHQQSESFLSETSTIQKGETNINNLDDVADSLNLKTGERVEFQMYGMNGPKSYKFGFDTGKGQNRHFRFEERDNTGKVKGHYGYLDEDGKMRIMKYEADPITGFHAGPVEFSPDDN